MQHRSPFIYRLVFQSNAFTLVYTPYRHTQTLNHRHLWEIDCPLAIVGRPATGAECGANQYTCPAYGAKKCFIAAARAGDITTSVNKGKRARPMISLLFLDVYALNSRAVYQLREYLLQKGKYHLYGWPPVFLVCIQRLYLCWNNSRFTCLIKSKPVKQEVSRTVILPFTK